MGSEIYIFVGFSPDELPPADPLEPICIQTKLFVIGEDDVSKIVETPGLGRYSSFPSKGFFCVVNSRLFFVGGSVEDYTPELKKNGILSLDLDEPLYNWKWKKSPLGSSSNEFLFAGGGTAVSGGNLIYAIGWQGDVLAFDSKTMAIIKRNQFNTAPEMRCYLLAVTETRIYVNCIRTIVNSSDKFYSMFGYCDIGSLNWNIIHRETTCLFYQNKGGVVIGDKYLIYFLVHEPCKSRYCPGLYVYDIVRDKWLKKPVQKLLNNGFSFPSDAPCNEDDEYNCGRVEKYGDPIMYTSLMRIRGAGKPELAFVWRTLEADNTSVFHVSRFKLDVVNAPRRGRDPTFNAEKVRHHVHFSVPKQVYDSKSAPSS